MISSRWFAFVYLYYNSFFRDYKALPVVSAQKARQRRCLWNPLKDAVLENPAKGSLTLWKPICREAALHGGGGIVNLQTTSPRDGARRHWFQRRTPALV
jgi:hypothetical protein